MVRTPLNEDLVYLYIMGSLYKGEDAVVKVGIGKDATKRATEVGGEVLFRSRSPQLRPIWRKFFIYALTIYMVMRRFGKGQVLKNGLTVLMMRQ